MANTQSRVANRRPGMLADLLLGPLLLFKHLRYSSQLVLILFQKLHLRERAFTHCIGQHSIPTSCTVSAHHRKMAAFIGRWPQEFMTLQSRFCSKLFFSRRARKFAAVLLIFRYSVKTLRHLQYSRSRMSQTSSTANSQFLQMIWPTFYTLSSVTLDDGRPECSKHSTKIGHFWNANIIQKFVFYLRRYRERVL